jgi:uncharacterized membrane protein YgdD (TMEM256/DUF423 family)
MMTGADWVLWKGICVFLAGIFSLSYGWLQMSYARGNLRRGGWFAICGAILTFCGTLMILSWEGNRIMNLKTFL